MAKLNEDQRKRLQTIQDASDDDTSLDVTKKHKRIRQAHIRPKGGTKEREETPAEKKKETRNLLIVIGSIAIIFIIFIAVLVLYHPTKQVMTIDELHAANAQGKLKPEQGYIYKGYSFVNFGGIWYSQVQKGSTLYDISFNNDPKSVEDVPVEGKLSTRFKQGNKLYITFDPYARATKYIAVANAGLSLSLVKGFRYNLTAGCTNNESLICQSTHVISCDDKDKAVIYFKEANETKVVLEDNCVTIQGAGPGIVRAKDRLLLRWYGMMD